MRSAVSITFRRFTIASVCAALRLPSCLLSSFACLCGNDSKLDLLHFHGFTHSQQFRRMLQDGAAAAASGGQRTAAVRNVSSKLMRSHGGGEQSSAQLVEGVIAFLQSVSQSARTASSSHTRNAMPSEEQQVQHSSTMRQLAAHLFGAEPTAARRPSPRDLRWAGLRDLARRLGRSAPHGRLRTVRRRHPAVDLSIYERSTSWS